MTIALQDPLVFDTSAVYCFGHRDGLEFLLRQLRQQFRLLIPTTVEEEVTAEESFDYHAFIARHFEVRPARAGTGITVNDLARLSADLDRGEIDVILLTTEFNGTAIIDERKARRIASERGLMATGTFGLMSYAIDKGWMTDQAALVAVAALRVKKFRCPDPSEFTTYTEYLASLS